MEDIFKDVKKKKTYKEILSIFDKLEEDPVYHKVVHDNYGKGLPDTRSFVYALAKKLAPKTFLEVGVRRGWSTACVAVASPEVEIFAFDEWHVNYGGAPNPGPDFVQSELAKVGYTKPINFISGNSHVTLRKFFKDNPGKEIDMVLVDGDHENAGALQDLKDTMPHISLGGVIIFDDIHDYAGLLNVWNNMVNTFAGFEYYSFIENTPGVGFAVRTI